MANKNVIQSSSKKMGKAIAFLKDAVAELLSAKKILEEDNASKKVKDPSTEEIVLYIDDALVEAENLQKDIFGIGVRIGGNATENIEEAQKFKIFCSLKDLYKDNGLPYYFVSYEKTLKECVSSMYMSKYNAMTKNAQQVVAVIMMAINKFFETDFSTDTLQNITTRELVELIFVEKEKNAS